MQLSKYKINPLHILAFLFTAIFSVMQDWSLPEFCWSTWLAALVYSWGCVLTASIQLLFTSNSVKQNFEERLAFIQNISQASFLIFMIFISIIIGYIGFNLYTTLFGFYGLFLSVFAEMEPHNFFGRNGFINSDFYSPLLYLLNNFWPMALGVIISNWEDFFLKSPWKRIILPFQAEVLRIHIMTIALPFISLLAWVIFKGAYQPITIVLLLGIFFLLPNGRQKEKIEKNRLGNVTDENEKI